MTNLPLINPCKLCFLNEAGTQESHIIPQFFTNSIYFKNGRNQGGGTIKFVDRIPKQVDKKLQQDVLKESNLFCAECENLLH